MTPARAWVRLQSGRRLDLLEPDPNSWTDSDLAIGLSRTYRWGGHSCWDLPLSVAQHSLLVLVLRQKLRPLEPLTRGEALRELLHDADEGLLSYDPISPVKPHLGADFHALAGRMQIAVQTRYGLLPWDDDSYAVHKQADRLAAASEALHVAGWSLGDLHETLAIDIPPLIADPPAGAGRHAAMGALAGKDSRRAISGEAAGVDDARRTLLVRRPYGHRRRHRTRTHDFRIGGSLHPAARRGTQTMRVGSARQQPQGHLRIRGSRRSLGKHRGDRRGWGARGGWLLGLRRPLSLC